MSSQPSKFTLLRRYKENDIIEPADIAIERMATDAELEGVWRNPQRWSCVVRSPSRETVAWGEAGTMQECLDLVASLAPLRSFFGPWTHP
jgi:hypothetical protein